MAKATLQQDPNDDNYGYSRSMGNPDADSRGDIDAKYELQCDNESFSGLIPEPDAVTLKWLDDLEQRAMEYCESHN